PHQSTPFPYTTLFRSALDPPYFKNIRKVRIELNQDGETNKLKTVIQQANVLVTAGLSEELQAESMDASTGQAFIAIQRAINIGKDRKSTRLNSSHEWI